MSGPVRRYDLIKRGLDVIASAVLLVVLSPLLLVLAVMVGAKLGRPVLFLQPRPGIDGREFTLVKFRSMLQPTDVDGEQADEPRMTSFGAKLRATSLDELPTLWNVLRGDMSFVGPRPLLVEYLPRYTPEQARRHEVRPGVTGLAQVRGRNSISWEEKFQLDVTYVDSRSFAVDSRILAATVGAVFRQHGISSRGHVTMLPFEGNAKEMQ